MSEPCPDCKLLSERVTQLQLRIFERFDLEKEQRDALIALNRARTMAFISSLGVVIAVITLAYLMMKGTK